MARLSGIEVPELSFGFGPKLISYRGKTEYSLRLIPFGGFCRLEEKDGIKFRDYPAFKRFLVFIGGSLFNIIMAILLLFIIYFAIFGTPMVNDTIVGAKMCIRDSHRIGQHLIGQDYFAERPVCVYTRS